MFFVGQGSIEFVLGVRRSAADAYLNLHDRSAAEVFLRQFKGDYTKMSQLRGALADSEPSLWRMTDDHVIALLASQLARGHLLIKDPNRRSFLGTLVGAKTSSEPEPAPRRPMSGYFMMLKYILRARSFEQLEDLAGYRRGRLSAKGALIYRFLRVPEITEFEVRGSTITPKHKWDAEDAKIREAELAKVAAYHRVTKVPSFDEIQRRNARETMDVSGDNTLVKIYPLDWQPVDDKPEGYPPGHGIPQWRLTDDTSRTHAISGALLFRISPGKPLPWVE